MITQNWQLYLGMSLTGLFTGIGSAVASYIVNKHLIERIEKLKINGITSPQRKLFNDKPVKAK